MNTNKLWLSALDFIAEILLCWQACIELKPPAIPFSALPMLQSYYGDDIWVLLYSTCQFKFLKERHVIYSKDEEINTLAVLLNFSCQTRLIFRE